MDKQVIIQMEINMIKNSISRICELCNNRAESYFYKNILERILFNKMFYYFKR